MKERDRKHKEQEDGVQNPDVGKRQWGGDDAVEGLLSIQTHFEATAYPVIQSTGTFRVLAPFISLATHTARAETGTSL